MQRVSRVLETCCEVCEPSITVELMRPSTDRGFDTPLFSVPPLGLVPLERSMPAGASADTPADGLESIGPDGSTAIDIERPTRDREQQFLCALLFLVYCSSNQIGTAL